MTPFMLWIRRACRDSRTGLSVTNVDADIEDYRDRRHKRTMLMEEKQFMGLLEHGQAQHFMRLDRASRLLAESEHGEHWGFYLVQFSRTGPLDSRAIILNGVPVTPEQLRRLINFEDMPVPGLNGYRPEEWARFIRNHRRTKP